MVTPQFFGGVILKVSDMALSSLASQLVRDSSRSWNDGSHGPALVTFSFATTDIGFGGRSSSITQPFSEAQQQSVRMALDAWGSVSGLSLVEVPDVADTRSVDLRFRLSDSTSTYTARSPLDGGDITLALSYGADTMAPGSEAYEVLLLVTGYALGLNSVSDSLTAGTAMAAYSKAAPNIATLRAADVEAIQYTYGTQQSEDAAQVRWSWDTTFAGIRHEGNATSQTINSSMLRDVIYARDGDDRINAGDGDDVIFAGNGDDTVDAGAGNDLIYAGPGNNHVSGSEGIDTLATGSFRREIIGVNGSVLLTKDGERTWHDGIENFAFADGRLVFNLADPVAQVVRMYQAALGRVPDSVGREFWADKVAAGTPLSDLAKSFLDSPEFLARFGKQDDSGFIGTAYRQALGREADAGGQSFWQGKMAGGMTRGELLANFSESNENRALTAPLFANGVWDSNEQMASMARLYTAVLGRAPEMEGLRYWNDQASQGVSEARIANQFAASAEFNSRFPGATDSDFVSMVYQNTLGRGPDAGGQAFWVDQLSHGMTRGEMVASVSHSPEFLQLTAGMIEGGITFA